MAHKLFDIPLTTTLVEHYLFDLGQSVEKTAEILDMDEEKVRRLHDDYTRFTSPTRRDK